MATTIYEIPLISVEKFYKDNPFISYLLEEYGFDAFDIDKNFPGSIVDGYILYLLDTDYEPVEIMGRVIDKPENLLIEFSIEDLYESGIISSSFDETIKRYLSEYELKPFDVDEVATEIILSGDYTFSEVAKAADKLGYLDDLL